LEDKQYHEKNYRQALIYLDSALFFTLPEIHASERLGIYSDMADIYLELKKYDKAYNCADSSLTYAKQVANPYKVKNALELLYNCSKLSGEYERALTVYEDLVLMRDSVLKIENNKLFSELEDKYHRVRKEKTESEYEQDRKLLTKQREIGNLRSKLITVGIVISALLLFYIIIIFRQKNIRSKQKRLEVEQRLQRARINPDFIYKALNNLQKMAVDDPTNTAIAKKLASFTKLMKQTLDSSHDDFLTLDKEIDFLTYYMELQRDRLKQRFVFSFEVDEQLNQADVCLPTMILQPFIESTIEQGFKNLDHEGQITISFKQQQHELRIRIDDNGKGLKSGSSARASEIINDRFYLLNKMNKTSASYLIRERNSGGVQVEIFLPLITREMAESRRKDD
jgi:tetratricopeptide (TPR) repeat protein